MTAEGEQDELNECAAPFPPTLARILREGRDKIKWEEIEVRKRDFNKAGGNNRSREARRGRGKLRLSATAPWLRTSGGRCGPAKRRCVGTWRPR